MNSRKLSIKCNPLFAFSCPWRKIRLFIKISLLCVLEYIDLIGGFKYIYALERAMAPRKAILPAAAMEKLLKKAGAERVADDGKEKLREVLEEYAQVIGEKALRLAHHAGRKTIKSSDIREAVK